MKEKDLRKMNRYQLLELLIQQTERADKLQAKLELAEQQLTKQVLQISDMGSIAEASLHLNGVFEAAQDAADMYLEAAKIRAEEEADRIIRAAQEQAKEILFEAHYDMKSR